MNEGVKLMERISMKMAEPQELQRIQLSLTKDLMELVKIYLQLSNKLFMIVVVG